MKKVLVTFVFFCTGTAISAPELKLPFASGEEWQVTRGYYTPGSNTTHQNWGGETSNDYYALDFAYPHGCGASYGRDVLAVADGTVTFAGDNGLYGLTVLINHGDGYVSRVSHLSEIAVSTKPGKNFVVQGQVIGKAGNSGNAKGSCGGTHAGAHIHFAMYHNGQAYKPEPMSGFTNFRKYGLYRSDNAIADATVFEADDICNNDACPISTWQFSTGELFGWYPAGDCLAAQKWFRLNRTEDDTLVPVSFTEAYYPCQCR